MTETPTAATADRKPRFARRQWWPRVALALSAAALLVVGVGWYYAGEVVKVTHSPPEFGLTVAAFTDTEVTLPAEQDTLRPGTWGLQWPNGRAVLGDVIRRDEATVVREVQEVLFGEPRAGVAARIDGWTYGEDPKQAHGLDFREVDVPTELGPAPAWHVPGSDDTWIIAVHGRNASPGEALRAIPAYDRLGHPVLAITHRNDLGAPASADGYHHLGATEWRDVAAAIDYAVDHGAKDVVLHGWSMGGAVAMMTLRESDASERVAGIVLDSPVLDWNSTLDKQGGQRWLPGPLISLAKGLTEWRADVDLDALDQRPFASGMTVPTLLFADTADETVDVSATLEFADRMPSRLLTLVKTRAGHTASWNADPAAYDAELKRFLEPL